MEHRSHTEAMQAKADALSPRGAWRFMHGAKLCGYPYPDSINGAIIAARLRDTGRGLEATCPPVSSTVI